MTRQVQLLYLSSNEWGNLGRRKVRLAHEFARRDDVAAVLYVNPPVPSSLLKSTSVDHMEQSIGYQEASERAAQLHRDESDT